MERQSATAAAAALAVAGLVGAWPLGAHGTQLTLGESTSGQYGFTPGGAAGFVDIAAASPIQGVGFFPPDSGDWQLGVRTPTTAGPLVGGAFATAALQSFAYSGSDGDGLIGQIIWSSLKDGSDFPDLIGTLTYSASGDAAWLANWGSTGTASIDITLDLEAGSPTLEAIAAAQQGSALARLSAGQVVNPQPGPIPESGSLQLLATALLCLGGSAWLRRRRGS